MPADSDDSVFSAFSLTIVLLLVTLLLFLALLFKQTLLTVLCILILTVAIATRVWSRWSGAHIHCRVTFDRNRLFPGESLDLAIQVENHKLLPVWISVGIRPGTCLRAVSGNGSSRLDCGLLWYQRATFRRQMAAVHRGVYSLGPLRLETADLLGFYPRSKAVGPAGEVVVYPRLASLVPLQLQRRDFFGIPGAKSPIEDPVYIHGTRDYQQRLPARFIHWKASARRDRLQEKVCEPAEQEKILIFVRADGFARDRSGDCLELCLEAVAAMAVEFDRKGFAVGLITNGRLNGGGRPVVSVSRSQNHTALLLETLARFDAVPQGRLVNLLQNGWTLPWGVTSIGFIFGHNDDSRLLQRYLQQRRVPLSLVECDPDADIEPAPMTDCGRICRLDDIRAEAEGNA